MNDSILNITEENNKFELFTQPLDSEVSFNEIKDKVAEALGLSDLSIEDLGHEIFWPKLIENYQQKRDRLMVFIFYF